MLQTWSPTGVPMLQLGDRIYKFFGSAVQVGWSTTGGAQSGTITDSRFTQYPGCTPFAWAITGRVDPVAGGLVLSVSGNVLTWSFPKASATATTRPDTLIAYGIY